MAHQSLPRLRLLPPADAGLQDDAAALDRIRAAWISWATHRQEADAALGDIAEALEGCGRNLIETAAYPANDG